MEEENNDTIVFDQEQLEMLHLNDICNVVAYSVMSLGKILPPTLPSWLSSLEVVKKAKRGETEKQREVFFYSRRQS